MAIPGIPILKSGKLPAPVTSVIGAAINKLWGYLFPGDKWGIYYSGSDTQSVEIDSLVEIGMSASSEVSTFKIETGSFVSYNKVANPSTIMCRVTKEGDSFDRAYLSEWMAKHVAEVTKFDIVMPEKVYHGYTLSDYRIVRTATTGVGMLIADMAFSEIREKTADYSSGNIANPNNAPTTQTSRVQLGDAVEPVREIKWQ
jgi:hypothetical protein